MLSLSLAESSLGKSEEQRYRQYADGKHIYPIPVENLECYASIPETAWNAYKTEVDGTTYHCGVPVNVQAPMLYYRTDLLPEGWEKNWDKNGNNTPDMIESWNDMYAFSVDIKTTSLCFI